MTALAKLSGKWGLRWWCPGCEENHIVPVRQLGARHNPDRPNVPDGWDWNESWDSPTLQPSVLVCGGSENSRCHCFVREGTIEFLADSSHALAGQTVPMVPVSSWP